MATNIDLLREGLHDYIATLEAHNLNLDEDFQHLSRGFAVVGQVYEGEAATAFKNSWQATAQWFENYIHETQVLIRFLQERVSWLERENREP